jgi:adenylate cyclase
VLFAEVAAPAGLTGTLGLEELRDLVGASLAAVIAEMEALGGMVTSVSGRGLQAMFGAPEAHEDDPERAVRAAFRALSATAAAGAPGGGTRGDTARSAAVGELALRIGVESGPAVVGPIGGGARVEYTALGDVVSVAAALQSAARPGSVLVGPATRTVTGHLFSWGARQEVTPAPEAGPLIASYLDAPRATAAERLPRLGGRAPLAGRQAELRLLDGSLREAVAGRGGVVVLTGEPGLGKTRLVHESRKRFIAWVGAGSGSLPIWLEGRGVSYASATPYGVFRQLVASWIGVSLDQPPAALRAALADALIRLMGNTNLFAPLTNLMGLPQADLAAAADSTANGPGAGRGRVSPEESHRQTFAAMRALVARFAAVAPTVLVLEDLHWADPTSLRLIAELAELTASRPLLLLATTRPGAGPAVAGLSGRPLREIRLEPLRAADAEALAMSLIGQVGGQEVLSAALDSAEGNPLFLEERLAEMLETGFLVREQGTWRLHEPAGDRPPPAAGVAPSQVALPLVLERLVRSRVDRLSPAAGEAIRAAAVLGPEFTAAVLAATLGSPPAALGPVIDELCASELVHYCPPELKSTFRFRHALIQEATYLALLRAERRDLHARAARAIESAAAGRLSEIAALLGRHYAAAELAESAVHYLELAGDQATDAFANDEAIASFREAIALAERAASHGAVRPTVSDAVRMHAKLANVLWRVVRHDEARDAFKAALRLADASQLDPLLRAHLHTRIGRLEMAELRYAAANAEFDVAEALLGDNPDDWDDATADQWLEIMVDGRADLHQMRFEPDLALAVLERARPVLGARGRPARETAFYRIFTLQRVVRNRMRVDDEDIACLRQGIAAAEHTGEDKDVGYATSFLGWALWLRGDLAAAAEQLDKGLALAERIGENFLRDVATLTLTLTAVRRHDIEEVRTLVPRVLAADSTLGPRAAGGVAVAAWLAWQDGRPDEVIRLAAEIEQQSLKTLSSGARYRWVYLFPLIAVHLSAGALAEAVTAARRVLDPSQQLLPADLTAALTEACTAWDAAAPAATRRHLAAALERARAHAYF